MAEIKTFENGSPTGTFSQLNYENGEKILISITQTEIAILKVGFLGIPKGVIWKEDIFKFMEAMRVKESVPEVKAGAVLVVAVDMAMQCKGSEEAKKIFEEFIRI